jgi:hypothetical protein
VEAQGVLECRTRPSICQKAPSRPRYHALKRIPMLLVTTPGTFSSYFSCYKVAVFTTSARFPFVRLRLAYEYTNSHCFTGLGFALGLDWGFALLVGSLWPFADDPCVLDSNQYRTSNDSCSTLSTLGTSCRDASESTCVSSCFICAVSLSATLWFPGKSESILHSNLPGMRQAQRTRSVEPLRHFA